MQTRIRTFAHNKRSDHFDSLETFMPLTLSFCLAIEAIAYSRGHALLLKKLLLNRHPDIKVLNFPFPFAHSTSNLLQFRLIFAEKNFAVIFIIAVFPFFDEKHSHVEIADAHRNTLQQVCVRLNCSKFGATKYFEI